MDAFVRKARNSRVGYTVSFQFKVALALARLSFEFAGRAKSADLRRASGIPRQGGEWGAMLDEMLKDEDIVLEEDPDDGRGRIVQITRPGLKRVHEHAKELVLVNLNEKRADPTAG